MTNKYQILCNDAIVELKKLDPESVDLILSDIPYGIGFDDWDILHNNQNSAYGKQSPSQNGKSSFKRRGKPLNGWSKADKEIPQEYQNWCETWLPECFRILKNGGSIIIFSGRRYSHRCLMAMENSGFVLKDILTWEKEKAIHRAQRLSQVLNRRGNDDLAEKWTGWRLGNLMPLSEPIIWAFKPYTKTITDNILEYNLGGYNQESWFKYWNHSANIVKCGMDKKEGGLHPTQKPIKLMKALIELVTVENQTVLDPFAGSGTTLLAALELKRNANSYRRQLYGN